MTKLELWKMYHGVIAPLKITRLAILRGECSPSYGPKDFFILLERIDQPELPKYPKAPCIKIFDPKDPESGCFFNPGLGLWDGEEHDFDDWVLFREEEIQTDSALKALKTSEATLIF